VREAPLRRASKLPSGKTFCDAFADEAQAPR
jgi:hypothetical protein